MTWYSNLLANEEVVFLLPSGYPTNLSIMVERKFSRSTHRDILRYSLYGMMRKSTPVKARVGKCMDAAKESHSRVQMSYNPLEGVQIIWQENRTTNHKRSIR